MEQVSMLILAILCAFMSLAALGVMRPIADDDKWGRFAYWGMLAILYVSGMVVGDILLGSLH